MSDLKKLIESVDRLNEAQKLVFLDKIVAKYAKAGMTQTDIASLEKEARNTRPPEGITSGFITPDYRVRYALANAGEAIGTGGLFGSDGSVSYLDNAGEVKTARGDAGVAQQLAKKGLLSPEVAKRYNIKIAAPTNQQGADVAVTPVPVSDNPNTSVTTSSSDNSLTKFVTTKVAADSVTAMSQFQADQLSKDLLEELRKLMNILNDSKLNFKSSIALTLVEADVLYERELSSTEEEKLRTIIHNLKVLEPKTGTLVKALVSNSLNRVPPKYSATAPAATPAATPAASAAAPAATPAAAPAGSVSNRKITWQDLTKSNPEIKDPNKIYPGQQIKLPNGSSAVVDQGDTLSGIAQRYNQGGYDDGEDTATAPAATTAPAAASTAPAAAPAAPGSTMSKSQTAKTAMEIKSGLAGSGLSTVSQDPLDRIFMNIKSKADFDAIDVDFKRTSRKGIVDAVKSEFFYNKDKQFNPMLKRLGIPVS